MEETTEKKNFREEIQDGIEKALKQVFSNLPTTMTLEAFRNVKHIGKFWNELDYNEQSILLGYLFGEISALNDELSNWRENM